MLYYKVFKFLFVYLICDWLWRSPGLEFCASRQLGLELASAGIQGLATPHLPRFRVLFNWRFNQATQTRPKVAHFNSELYPVPPPDHICILNICLHIKVHPNLWALLKSSWWEPRGCLGRPEVVNTGLQGLSFRFDSEVRVFMSSLNTVFGREAVEDFKE